MTQHEMPLFIDIELDSYLPTGWRLMAPESGVWNRKKSEWTVKIVDGAEMDWDLTIRKRDVKAKGRMEALRYAVDVLHRERLG